MPSGAILILAVTLATGPVGRAAPKGWTSNGAMGVKFGMGPGDVQAVYLGLEEAVGDEAPYAAVPARTRKPHPITAWRAVTELQEEKVEVSFLFLRGRLYCVSLTPVLPLSKERSATWVKRVQALLEQKYGLPSSTASGAHWTVQDKMKVWLSEPLGTLTYTDIEGTDEARAAMDLWREDAKEAVDRSDRERL